VFQLLAKGIDTSKALAEIEARPVLWSLFTGRQTQPGSPHHDTECIVLRGPAVPDLGSVFTDLNAYDYPVIHALPETVSLLQAIFNDPEVPDFHLGRVMIVKLNAGGQIAPHIDEGVYAEHFDTRLHLVLSSEEGNEFRCGGLTAVMKPGTLWKFDHRQLHSAVNNSNSPRVHVIIDGHTAPAE
jgi:hypothetical protein